MSTSGSSSNAISKPSVKSGPVKPRAKNSTTSVSNVTKKKITQVSHSDVSRSSMLKDIINKNIQTLSNILKTRPEKINSLTTIPDTNFQTLADETLSAIYELEKVEKSKVMQLKIDKAFLSLIVKLIEFGLVIIYFINLFFNLTIFF